MSDGALLFYQVNRIAVLNIHIYLKFNNEHSEHDGKHRQCRVYAQRRRHVFLDGRRRDTAVLVAIRRLALELIALVSSVSRNAVALAIGVDGTILALDGARRQRHLALAAAVSRFALARSIRLQLAAILARIDAQIAFRTSVSVIAFASAFSVRFASATRTHTARSACNTCTT
jgi:hypothetical protein